MNPMSHLRLDASESVFFERQLEAIDTRIYEYKFEGLKARQLLPTVQGIADWQNVYTYRMSNQYGSAKPISDWAKDLPRADVEGSEVSQLIKHFGASYGWNYYELKRALATNTDLDGRKGRSARMAIDTALDTVLALGDASLGLKGLLNLSSTTTYTLPNKGTSGSKAWGTLAAPVATAAEVANDLRGFASNLYTTCKEVFDGFTIVLPVDKYEYAAAMRFPFTGDTALDFALKSDHIKEIVPWSKCTLAGSGGSVDRMVAYPKDEIVLGAIVPEEFTIHPVERKGLSFEVPCTASCGGVIVRYSVAVSYADGL